MPGSFASGAPSNNLIILVMIFLIGGCAESVNIDEAYGSSEYSNKCMDIVKIEDGNNNIKRFNDTIGPLKVEKGHSTSELSAWPVRLVKDIRDWKFTSRVLVKDGKLLPGAADKFSSNRSGIAVFCHSKVKSLSEPLLDTYGFWLEFIDTQSGISHEGLWAFFAPNGSIGVEKLREEFDSAGVEYPDNVKYKTAALNWGGYDLDVATFDAFFPDWTSASSYRINKRRCIFIFGELKHHTIYGGLGCINYGVGQNDENLDFEFIQEPDQVLRELLSHIEYYQDDL